MDQFDSKHQRPAPAPAPAAASKIAPKESLEPIAAKTAKLSLNSPPVKLQPERAMDPIVLGKGAAAPANPGPNAANDRPSAQLQVDHEVIDTVTLNVRALLSGHPGAAKPQESNRLAEDRIKVEASRSSRKGTEQNERVQQTVETDRAQQKTVSQQQVSTHSAELASREKIEPKNQAAAAPLKSASVAPEVHRTVTQEVRQAQAVELKQNAERNETAAQSGLASRNSSREGERASVSQDLVRSMSEQDQSKPVNSEYVQPAAHKSSAQEPSAEVKRGEQIRSAMPRPDGLESKIEVIQQALPAAENWQTIPLGLGKVHHRHQNPTDELLVQQRTQRQVQQAEEEEEREEREKAVRRRKLRANVKLRSALQKKKALKKKTPRERYREMLKLERQKRKKKYRVKPLKNK